MENEILNLFAQYEMLSFHEIQNLTKTRSNRLAYHLKKLLRVNKIEKQHKLYKLAINSEFLIPYLSTKHAIIPVVLVLIKNKGSIFLIKRTKRPFKGKWGLPGGRLLVGESPEKAAKRIMKEKCAVEITNPQIEKIALEHVKKQDKIIHSFILMLVIAKTDSPLKMTPLKKKANIIKSDYHLITTQTRAPLETIYSQD